ncbi:Ig-like domain-containing protein [Ligilactobacillus cholophilus]|uniref:Ig-like domain-containing protein n=1 Tax=Ligilactobacillus cholophilus TaxID=3050131 RepID=UPI0025B0B55F|nr:Ig-like domain-containing protein [Ligilactobacillus cholophilus]
MRVHNFLLVIFIILIGLIYGVSKVRAAEIIATGTNGSEAIVTTGSGRVITDTSKLSKYRSYNIDWNFNIPDNVSIQQGDTLKFQLPTNMAANANLNFDVKNSENIVIGNFVINEGDQSGTLTFNNYFKTHNDFDRHGSIHITANGSVASSENEDNWNINKVAWVDNQDHILWNIAVNAEKGYSHLTIKDTADNSQTILENSIVIQQGYYTEEGQFIATKTLPVDATVTGNQMTINLNNINGIVNITYQSKSNKIGTLTNDVQGFPSGGQGGKPQSSNWECKTSIFYDGDGNISDETSSNQTKVISSSLSSNSEESSSTSSSVINSSSTQSTNVQSTNLISQPSKSSNFESSSSKISSSSNLSSSSSISKISLNAKKTTSSNLKNDPTEKSHKLVLPNLGSSNGILLEAIGVILLLSTVITFYHKNN